MLKKINRQYLLDRLKEQSTWYGIVAFLTALGISITPETATKIATAGTAVAGLVAIVFPDNNR